MRRRIAAGTMRVAVLIPVLDEAETLPLVLAELPATVRVVVCDNGSTDGSAELARAAGAEVVRWEPRGYGGAVLAGLRHLAAHAPPEVVVVLDGDHSSFVEDLPALVDPILAGDADFVLGERLTRGDADALTPPQRYGNAFAVQLIALVSGHRYRDMGPFRALRFSSLQALAMEDLTWGWNVEMQLKALAAGLRIREVPVGYRTRAAGESKISGNVRGVLRAGGKILWAVWRYRPRSGGPGHPARG